MRRMEVQLHPIRSLSNQMLRRFLNHSFYSTSSSVIRLTRRYRFILDEWHPLQSVGLLFLQLDHLNKSRKDDQAAQINFSIIIPQNNNKKNNYKNMYSNAQIQHNIQEKTLKKQKHMKATGWTKPTQLWRSKQRRGKEARLWGGITAMAEWGG